MGGIKEKGELIGGGGGNFIYTRYFLQVYSHSSIEN